MKAWQAAGTVVITALIVLSAPTAASAEDPVTFGSSPIVDTAGVLDGDTGEITDAMDQLREDTGRQLFLAYVDEFTNPASAQEWADSTAIANNLGDEDYLLAVAVDGRSYWLSVSGDSTLTDEQLRTVTVDRIEPRLADEDWAGAAVAAAEALREGDGGGGWGLLWIFVGLVVVAGIVIFIVVRRRRTAGAAGTRRPADEVAEVSTEDLAHRVGSALVATDDAVRTSQEELGFAVASYGEEVTAEFRRALQTAQARLSEAFTVRQRLDDIEPDTEAQQRAWYVEILKLTDEANAMLDEQVADFDALRSLEQNAPKEVERLTASATAVEARVASANAALEELRGRYAETATASVADNPEQATSRIAFARAALTEAGEELTAGDNGAAAVAIRGAEESIDQADVLLDAIERLGRDLAAADDSITAGLADLRRDVSTARAFPVGGDPAGTLPATLTATETTIEEVGAAAGAAGRDPIELLQRLEQANLQIDGVLRRVQDAQAGAARARAALDQSMLAARSRVSAAEDFIVARRGAVGAEARTRLAEAGRLIVEADSLAASDPAQALGRAQRAGQLADQAMQHAQSDVGGFGGMGAGFGGGPGGHSRGGSDIMGAVLGGILINSVLGGGGGRRSGGFGGFGGGRGGDGIFGRRGGGIPGSFGGGATRSRRGGGGRF
jgi:hypothetical protein